MCNFHKISVNKTNIFFLNLEIVTSCEGGLEGCQIRKEYL